MPAATVPAGGRGSRGSSRIYRRAITGPHFRYSRCKGIFGVQFFQEGQGDECPASGEIGELIGNPVSKAQLPVKFDIDIFCGKFMVFHASVDILFQ